MILEAYLHKNMILHVSMQGPCIQKTASVQAGSLQYGILTNPISPNSMQRDVNLIFSVGVPPVMTFFHVPNIVDVLQYNQQDQLGEKNITPVRHNHNINHN